MKKLLVRSILFAVLASSLLADPVATGMPEAELLKSKGSPQTKAKLGKKSIYRWPDMEVIVIDGKVDSFKIRDAVAEREASEERAQAEIRRKNEAAAKAREKVLDSREATTYSRIDANAANRETENRMRRAANIQTEIRSIERQLSDDDKRSSFKGTPPMSAEGRALLNFRLDTLRGELAQLR